MAGSIPASNIERVHPFMQFMYDVAGKVWKFQLKTWHNVVASGGRATYVLENTGEGLSLWTT